MEYLIGLGVAGAFFILIFNTLVKKRNYVKQAMSGIDVQLKARFDLIPNLVESVKSHMQHEQSVLEELTKLRTQALEGGNSSEEKALLDNKITHTLQGLMVSVENYPHLKTDASFKELNAALREVESMLSAARRNFNSMVIDYNNSIEVFPNNFIAPMLGFRPEAVFVIPANEKQNISVGNLMKKSS